MHAAVRGRENGAQTALRGHSVRRCVVGAGGVGALWQHIGGTAAPGTIGAEAGGRVSPGANQPGHRRGGHWGEGMWR